MRMYGCDHCGAQETVEYANRRPVGWCTIKSSEVLQEFGPRRSVNKAEVQYELCAACTKQLNEFMSGGADRFSAQQQSEENTHA
ncbi:MAG: hypothetical protein WBZ37_19305 [Mycobacterium sp.]